MDNTQRFDGKADVYAKARPGYPKELFEMLQKEYGLNPDSCCAEFGAGTGKFTALLAPCCKEVYAIEPNADMRAQLEENLSEENVVILDGSAENSGLPEKSVDFVFAAQAFHWFDKKAFYKECQRILKPSGKVVLVWNNRNQTSEINRKTQELFAHYNPDYPGFSAGMQQDDPRIQSFFSGEYTHLVFKNPVSYDKNSFRMRNLSSSWAPSINSPQAEAFARDLDSLFDACALDGIVLSADDTDVYLGCLPAKQSG